MKKRMQKNDADKDNDNIHKHREKSSHDAQMNEKEYNKMYNDKLDVTFRVKFMLKSNCESKKKFSSVIKILFIFE